MITLGNNSQLTKPQRRASLFRARHTQPFFNLLEFTVDATGARQNEYKSKVTVNKDFFLTEIVGNFNDLEADSGYTQKWNASFYTSLNTGSIYRYLQGLLLPSGFLATEGRSGAAANVDATNFRFVDKQDEYCPYHIKAGDDLLGQIRSGFTKTVTGKICFKGYYVNPQRYLADVATKAVNESLARPIRYDTWRLPLAFPNGNEQPFNVTFTNDRRPRIVLGFAWQAKGNDPLDNDARIQIVDGFRDIAWCNEPIPLNHFAPRVPTPAYGCRDVDWYYLPVEYFLEPFAPLRCTISANTSAVAGTGYLTMLTRTV